MNHPQTDLSAWIGHTETAHDTVQPTPVAALAATLDRPAVPTAPEAALPPLGHWLYFLPRQRPAETGADGHARRGGFLPPVALPRRRWAGSQFAFRTPIRIGDRVARTSTLEDATAKDGRSSKLVFVRVRHDVRCNGAAAPALVEFHDIVHREAKQLGDADPPPQTAPAAAAWQREIEPDAVLLFRYSALTINGQRIDCDRRCVTEVQGYSGLVVHGPLIATPLLDLLRRERPDADLAAFRFKAVRPSFDLHSFKVSALPQDDRKTVRLWASDHEGWLTMAATATLR